MYIKRKIKNMKKLELHNIQFMEVLEQFKIRLQTQGTSEGQVYNKPNSVKEFLYYLEQNEILNLDRINQKLINQYFEYLKNRPLQTKDGTMSTGYLLKHREAVLRFIEFIKSQHHDTHDQEGSHLEPPHLNSFWNRSPGYQFNKIINQVTTIEYRYR